MSFIRPSTSSGAPAAAGAPGAAGASTGGYVNLASVSNSPETPDTVFSSKNFRPISSDGRGRTGPLSSEEDSFVCDAIQYYTRTGGEVANRLAKEGPSDSKDIALLKMCTEELIAFKSIKKAFTQDR